MMRHFLLFMLILTKTSLFSQHSLNNIFEQLSGDSSKATVKIIQEQRIKDLVQNTVYLNKRTSSIPGYRIKIYADLGNYAHDGSIRAQTKFIEAFPDVAVYRKYQTPYYRVYAGNFRSRVEAYQFYIKVREIFPYAYIVPTKIHFPDLKN